LKVLTTFAILCAVTCGLWAQGASSLRGTVTDPQKAVISAAKITLTDIDEGAVRAAVSSPSGEYQFLQVRPGNYSLTVESPGFATGTVSGIKLLVDTPSTVDVSLELAGTSSTVSVVAETAQLNTVDASVGNAFQEKQIQSLPLQTRNVVQLLGLQPGVTQNGEVMGARRDQNNILLDGVDNNDNQNPLSGQNGSNPNANSGTTTQGFNSSLPVPLDSVQEFRVTVAGQNAFAGRSSGGQVALVTRSGTNEMHGSAYEYNRNTAYAANDWFNNRAGLDRARLVRNQFGASLGGPVKKNRLFYFANYERRIDASQQTQTRTVPTETLKAGKILFKTTDGTLFTLSPNDVRAVDPLHIGATQKMLDILDKYPVGNAPQIGSDGGLNFTGYLFNAPVKLDYRTYVTKLDWLIDNAGKHTVSFRGTLSNNGETRTAAQFAGQEAAQQLLSDNRGFGIRYNALLSPNLTNTANVGLNRIGFGQTGATSPSFSLGAISTLENFSRASGRINPVWNFSDDLNWVKGRHIVTTGVNFRWIDNRVLNYGNSYPSYSMARGILLGLGQDIYTNALSYVANGNSALKLANATALTNAFGDALGVLNSYGATYQFRKDGTALAFGDPRQNDFVAHNYEFYLQDSWKVTPKLTVTYGLHYEYDTVPYEVDGTQVITTPGLDQFFANRVGAQASGTPGNLLPNNSKVTYTLAGPANGKPGWYGPDKNNFAPRLALAYAPDSKTAIRLGAGMAYDQFGNDLVTNVASTGSLGLSTSLSNASSTDFSSSPRFANGLPTLPAAPQGGFPYTPPNISAISGTYVGIMPDLKAPYSYLLNASVSRQLKDNLTIEVGYTGRMSHKLLIQQDVYSPLIYFKDPKSGTNWTQAGTAMRQLSDGGVTAAAVQKNPALVPSNPFVENMFPALTNLYIPGSASANYFYSIYGKNAGSDLDSLHQLDRVTSAQFPNCIVATGCYTFFAPQGSSNPTWTNAGFANYNAMLVTVRRSLSKGFAFDLNYTWSHSIDNGSTAASGAGRSGGVLQNAFVLNASRGSSDFDFRHLINANVTYALPFGKGKMLLNTRHRWMDEIVGGWQVSSLIRVQSGQPRTISGSDVYPTNYWNSSLAIPRSGTSPQTGLFTDATGNPSIFQSVGAAGSYQDAYPGGAGLRGIVRMPWQRNVDLAVQKDFPLPWERHSLQFRAEAFNAFNFVNFTTISLSLTNPGTFGQFSAAQDPRVLQLALRYSF
jgi:hypothetical protein